MFINIYIYIYIYMHICVYMCAVVTSYTWRLLSLPCVAVTYGRLLVTSSIVWHMAQLLFHSSRRGVTHEREEQISFFWLYPSGRSLPNSFLRYSHRKASFPFSVFFFSLSVGELWRKCNGGDGQ
ncbi:hypothetical protein, unlikely [Trypanosoma brucei gambiense DAL972]|uniref:Uncharacterized protein n=1 Tax=Trypanosoma brucei gambiense (strain MHOM/CI/86/DAL972) TaxID=679716 RepID=C9ZND3_TRYB9|nr:hypothetical protein, unlikely [Trypanosoma brucei gambiense DAL972]CBH10911.1 hypothetical protein, unlikely [Trypanosoma brucei gambiense DAL972]|eukprot:XP_011773198.1 hypothetical protein, unlikely [Trypanosoma brucei gambiense DAL972]